MSDENVIPEEPAVKTYTQEEVDNLTSGLKSKNDELLGEKKEATRLAGERAESKRLAEEESARSTGKIQ